MSASWRGISHSRPVWRGESECCWLRCTVRKTDKYQSTLLQLLANRHFAAGAFARFSHTGQVLFAGQPASAASRSNVAFVEQDDDWHLPSLTVRETLRYAAMLRLPESLSRRQKVARAETVLLMLGLKDCADLPVGGALLKGISGGEKRRLSLAVQSTSLRPVCSTR